LPVPTKQQLEGDQVILDLTLNGSAHAKPFSSSDFRFIDAYFQALEWHSCRQIHGHKVFLPRPQNGGSGVGSRESVPLAFALKSVKPI
jgi:hypothetical protein